MNPPMTCFQEQKQQRLENLLPQILDSLDDPDLLVISCNNQMIIRFDSMYSGNKSIIFRYEQRSVMNAYGFPSTPHLFKVNGLKIKKWKKYSEDKYDCK